MCLRSFVINYSCDHFDVWSATAIYYSKLELFNHRTVLHTEDNRKYRLASLMVFPIRQEKCTKTKKKNSERKIDDLIVVYPSHLFTHTHTHTLAARASVVPNFPACVYRCSSPKSKRKILRYSHLRFVRSLSVYL